MKPKTLILLGVAVVCGLGASYMTSRLLAERDDKPVEAPVIEKVTLLVAKKNIEIATPLRLKPADFFEERQYVKEDAPKDALTPDDLPKLKGKFIKRSLRKGDHVVASDLMENLTNLTALPNGMRAIGIPVNNPMSAGGFASLPGSHVDVYWTTRPRGDKDTFAKVLLENVVVLAADARTTNESGDAISASVVTVALQPEDALKLTLAMDMGSLRLIVRNLEDHSTSDKSSVSAEELMRRDKYKGKDPLVAEAQESEPEKPKAVEPPPQPKAVELPPQPKLRKMTATVRNGADVQLHHYWVDDNDQVVPNPQQREQEPVPAPSGKKDDKKTPEI